MNEAILNFLSYLDKNNFNYEVIYSSTDQLIKYFSQYQIFELNQSIFEINSLSTITSSIEKDNKYIFILTEYFNEYIKNFTKAEQEDYISKILTLSSSSTIIAIDKVLAESKLTLNTLNKDCSFIINLSNLDK